MSADKQHLSLTVSGRVQGVGYRAFSKEAARKTGIKGIVKNLAGGEVYIEAEGTSEQLEAFLNLCKKGPGWAHVEYVDVHAGPCKDYNSFDVKY